MGDLRFWTRELTIDLLRKYKSLPAIWDVNSVDYTNRLRKAAAYKDLVKFCKDNKIPNVTRPDIAKKIQSLRGVFRKEWNKIQELKQQGKPAKSHVWYYKYLLFLKGENESDYEEDESDEVDSQKFEESYLLSEDDISDDVDIERGKKPARFVSAPQSTPRKRPKRDTEHRMTESDYEMKEDTASTRHTLSEAELIGMNAAKKLARMNPIQAVYAESIINNILHRGLLLKLKDETNVCDNMCETKRLLAASMSCDTF